MIFRLATTVSSGQPHPPFFGRKKGPLGKSQWLA